ncbi:MAG: hypothetical protein QM813_09985 [Verrucomicrobiota bacterium]
MDAEFRRAFHHVRFRPETIGFFDGVLDADFGSGGTLLGRIRAERRAKNDDVTVQHFQRRRRGRGVCAVLSGEVDWLPAGEPCEQAKEYEFSQASAALVLELAG